VHIEKINARQNYNIQRSNKPNETVVKVKVKLCSCNMQIPRRGGGITPIHS
jgi:hypothetical protein